MRVRFIHLIKRVARPFLIEIIIAGAALLEVGRLVFVAQVFENAPPVLNVQASASFFTHALTNTNLSVQVMIALVAVAVVLAVKDVVKAARMLRNLRGLRLRQA